MPDKIMAAVEPADVAQMAVIETLRAIRDSMQVMQAESKEQAKLLVDVRERVVRIEAASVDQKLDQMTRELDAHAAELKILQEDKNRRDGAFHFVDTARRWLPAILTILAAVGIFLRATGRLGPR